MNEELKNEKLENEQLEDEGLEGEQPESLDTAPQGAMLLTAAEGETDEADEETAAEEPDEEYEVIDVNDLDLVKLGRQGEHMTQTVKIDCSAWLEKLPECSLIVAAIRPGESEVYLPTVAVEGGVITWNILDQDTAHAGGGRGEVRAMQGDKIKKSCVFRTRIEPSLEGSGSTPVTPPDWVQTILAAVGAAQTAAETAAAQARTAATQASDAAAQAAAAAVSAAQAATNTEGLRGFAFAIDGAGGLDVTYTAEE